MKKQIWGQVKKHPEPQSGFRLRSKVSLQYRKLKDLVRLQKKQGVITEDLRRRIKDFGKERPPHEIKEEREEQKVRNQEKRTKKRKTSEKTKRLIQPRRRSTEEESLSLPSPVPQPRTPDGPPPAKRPQARRHRAGTGGLGTCTGVEPPHCHPSQRAGPAIARLKIGNWRAHSKCERLRPTNLLSSEALKVPLHWPPFANSGRPPTTKEREDPTRPVVVVTNEDRRSCLWFRTTSSDGDLRDLLGLDRAPRQRRRQR